MIQHSRILTFPGSDLTLSQMERLTKLNEECVEVMKEVCKTQLHGFDSFNPEKENAPINRVKIQNELKDVLMWAWVMHQQGDIDFDILKVFEELPAHYEKKFKYFKFQDRNIC